MAESVGLKLGIYRCEWLGKLSKKEREIVGLFGKGKGFYQVR